MGCSIKKRSAMAPEEEREKQTREEGETNI